MPPKNKTSVARKIHMPSVEASFCCSTSSNWCRRAKEWLANLHLLENRIIVGFVRDHGRDFKVFGRRWRRHLPFEAGRVPGIVRSNLAVAQRPDEVDGRNHVAHREHR